MNSFELFVTKRMYDEQKGANSYALNETVYLIIKRYWIIDSFKSNKLKQRLTTKLCLPNDLITKNLSHHSSQRISSQNY